MIHIDPITRQRVTYQPNSGDLHYDLIGGSSISTQVVSLIGISGLTNMQQKNLGQSNALFGTDEGIEGARLPDLGITGENKQTTRRVRIRRIVNT